MAREFDIIVYGATGFTGRLVCEYLYQKKACKWAMAGRNLNRLKDVLQDIQMNGKVQDIPLLVATPEEPKSLIELGERTTVMINCAGPFTITGEVVVHACIESACHYVDITGEPGFWTSMVEKYHEKAKRKGVCIVHACGIDSIPWDLGVLHAVRGSTQRAYPRINSVTAYGKISIVPSLGTLLSMLHAVHQITIRSFPTVVDSWFGSFEENNPNPKSTLTTFLSLTPHVPLYPHYSPDLRQWVIPFPGAVDAMIVRRSARLIKKDEPSAPSAYHFGQYLAMGSLFQMLLVLWLAFTLGPVLIVIAKVTPLRALATQLLRSRVPEGPSPSQRKKASLEMFVIAKDSDGLQLGKSKIVCPSDPGYGSTAKWVAESAMCLVENGKNVEGGVVTTASCKAMGFKLINRLQGANLRFYH